MHTIIYAVVDAETSDDALVTARTAFDHLTGTTPGRARVFDYCLTLDCVGTDHPARAEGLPTAARLDTDGGKLLLGGAWAMAIRRTHDAIRRVAATLDEYDPRAIRRDEAGTRRALARLGRRESPTTTLYDEHGPGLVRRERVVDIVTTAETPWIVPADAHHHP